MSKRMVILVVLISIALFSFFIYHKPANLSNTSSPPPPSTSTEDVETIVSASDRYLPYTSSDLDQAEGYRRVLYFYASWCPTCIPADADFTKNQSLIPEDVRLIRVNYNDGDTSEEEKALAVKYGITYQHTFVQIDQAGNVITKWNGGQTPELIKNLK